MPVALGWTLIVFSGLLYIAQVISSINFRLAQKIGIQEHPEKTDPILRRAERYVAYWDLITLVWMPVTGVMILLQSNLAPFFGLVGGAIYVDAAGREALKILGLKHEGVRIGGEVQQKVFFASYIFMAILGLATLYFSAREFSGT